MGKNEQFHQYGYDHYLKAPKKPRQSKRATSSGALMGRGMHSPALAVVALLLAGGVFVGVIAATYPFSKQPEKAIPIVKADIQPIKRVPEEKGGMAIRNADSTVLAKQDISLSPGIENLLAKADVEEPVMKEEALEISAKDVGDLGSMDAEIIDGYLQAPEARNSQDVTEITVVSDETETQKVDVIEDSPVIEIVSSKSIDDQSVDVLQKISTSRPVSVSGFEKRVALAAVQSKPRNKKMHAAGQSPETLEFVRSVLKNQDDQASSLAAVEPASGAANKKAAISVRPGGFYVQLASIKDQSRAGQEWFKMKSKYNALSDVDYRVQQASLNSGTFYRIQAGPMSKASADKVCKSLKAAKKPGGCLVVKK